MGQATLDDAVNLGESHSLSNGKQIVYFNRLALYHKSPDSGVRQCESTT
jgi:hypothetical protein